MKHLVSVPLFSERVFLFIPQGHPLYMRNTLTMQDLIGKPFVMFSDEFRIAQHFFSSCHYAGFEPRIALRSSEFNSLHALALQRCLLFIAPEHMVDPGFQSFRYAPFPDPNFRWTAYLAIRRNKVITDTMLALENTLNNIYPPDQMQPNGAF